MIRPAMKKAGFQTKGAHYIRLTSGKMLQSFSFQSSSDGSMFTLNIGIMPLYETGCKWLHEPIRLGQLIGKGDAWWQGNENAVKEVSSLILNELLPLFEQCSSYDTYYHAVEAHIKPVNENELPDGGLALYLYSAPEMFCRLCLRTGHNDKAIICIQNTIHQIELSKRNVDGLNDELRDYKKQFAAECEIRVAEQLKLKQKAESNDISDILQEFDLVENENYRLFAKYSC